MSYIAVGGDPTIDRMVAEATKRALDKLPAGSMPGLTSAETTAWKTAASRGRPPTEQTAFLKGITPFFVFPQDGKMLGKFYDTKAGKLTIKSLPPSIFTKLKNLVCKGVNVGGAQIVAAAGGAVVGGPGGAQTGATSVDIARAICGSGGGSPYVETQPQQAGMGSGGKLLLIGGAVAVVFLALKGDR